MSDKDYDLEGKTEQRIEPATRARNRTVMLTPEITGQVRAKLNQSSGTQTATPYRETDVAATISPQSVAPGQGFYSQVVQPTLIEQEHSATVVPTAPAPRPTPIAPVNLVPPTPAPAAPQPQVIIPPDPRAAAPHPVAPAVPAPAPAGQYLTDNALWVNEAPLLGFLVTYDRNRLGDVSTLRSGRMIITSTPQTTGNYLLIDDTSVSPLHAIMRITASGEIQVLDQLSESGTFIRRFGGDEEIELSGDKSFLEHGDVIRFGERSFHVVMIVRSEQEG